MKASKAAFDIIKKYETLKLEVYLDPVGLPTIGWGHLITGDEDFPRKITRLEADALLDDDVLTAEDDVNRLVDVELNQKQYDALVSFVFNIGGSSLAESRNTLRIINSGDYKNVPAAMRTWCKGRKNGKLIKLAGLVRRRAEESALFEAGNREM